MKKEKNYKLFLLGEIREHTTKNRARKQQSLLGLAFFYTRHQRVSNKKNKKCSKWVIIEWETCVKKKKKLLQIISSWWSKGTYHSNLPQKRRSPLGQIFFTWHQRVNNKKIIFKIGSYWMGNLRQEKKTFTN